MNHLHWLADIAATLVRTNALSVVLVLVFASVALALAAGASVVGRRADAARRRLARGVPRRGAGDRAPSVRYQDDRFKWLDRLEPVYRHLVPRDEEKLRLVGRRLVRAGYRNPNAVAKFFGLRLVLAFALFLGALVPAFASLGTSAPRSILLAAFAAGLAGYFIPVLHVARRVAVRRRLIAEGFPDALDMLLVCVEAGLGLDAAIARVGADIGRAHPVIGEELHLTGLELRAGRGRQEALRDLGERTGIEDVRALVVLLVQSDALGTSIGQALRAHSFEMRGKRLMRAEETAHKIPVKLSLPLVFGLLPCLMTVVLAPAIIKALSFGFPILSRGMSGPGG
jgi:tight adherence protein C